MFTKVGMITVGVTAGLMVAAPFASAGEAPQHPDHHGAKSSGCSFTGGTGGGSSSGNAKGELAAVSGATAGGIGGNNVGNIADCSDFLNHNLNGNDVLSHNSVKL